MMGDFYQQLKATAIDLAYLEVLVTAERCWYISAFQSNRPLLIARFPDRGWAAWTCRRAEQPQRLENAT